MSPFRCPPPIRLRDKEAKLQEKIGEWAREHKQVKLLTNQVGRRRAGLWIGVAEHAGRWTRGVPQSRRCLLGCRILIARFNQQYHTRVCCP